MMYPRFSCSFVGCPFANWDAKDHQRLEKMIIKLIEDFGVTTFYYAGVGSFERICVTFIKKYQSTHPDSGIKNILATNLKDHFLMDSMFDHIIRLNSPKNISFLDNCFYRDEYIIDKSLFIICNFDLKHDNPAVLKDYEYAFSQNKIIILTSRSPVKEILKDQYQKLIKEEKLLKRKPSITKSTD